jgi:hypothetical protein
MVHEWEDCEYIQMLQSLTLRSSLQIIGIGWRVIVTTPKIERNYVNGIHQMVTVKQQHGIHQMVTVNQQHACT